ncbi:hypothetical protein [Bacillus thuringiensis]|uniref:hypothetical protein n=1 Tax=Bacillus thuringiensis TaxID=1428 RepID=UPI00366C1F92
MLNFYVTLFLIFGTAICLFFLSGSSKIKAKNLSLIMVCLGINLLTSPISLFIGGMATDSPYSTMLDFLGGFLFIQGIPLLLLLAAFLKFALAKKTKQV